MCAGLLALGAHIAPTVPKRRIWAAWRARAARRQRSGHDAASATSSTSRGAVPSGQVLREPKVEACGTRAENVPLAEWLVLAAALDVPPPLLVLPLGTADRVALTPNVSVHPALALRWMTGEETFCVPRRGQNISKNTAQWNENRERLWWFEELHDLTRAAQQAQQAVWSAEYDGDDADLRVTQQPPGAHARLDRAFRDLGRTSQTWSGSTSTQEKCRSSGKNASRSYRHSKMRRTDMASITKVSTGWRARYRTPDNASRSQTFARKVDAERFLTSVAHKKISGTYIDASAARTTLADW